MAVQDSIIVSGTFFLLVEFYCVVTTSLSHHSGAAVLLRWSAYIHPRLVYLYMRLSSLHLGGLARRSGEKDFRITVSYEF